jgi:16S rRNA (cytosine967-C5)-methyltransferase
MNVVGSQRHTFLQLLAQLRPHWRRDPNLPERILTALRRHRGIGARDRRLYRELLYTAVRHLPWIEGRTDEELVALVAALAADTPATRAFRAAFADPRLMESLPREALLPAWFRDECPEAFSPPQLNALLARAPLWLRLQTGEPARVFAEFADRGWAWQQSDLLPSAVKVLDEVDVTQTDSFAQGRFEVQDLGSQLLLESVGIEPGGRWLDACAGAGGKTLQLARLLGPDGQIDAHDIRPAALSELTARARKAGIPVTVVHDRRSNDSGGHPPPPSSGGTSRPPLQLQTASIAIVAKPSGPYDGVLVDAPCSGSGTWRRAPHLKWVTTPESIARAAAIQQTLLAQFAAQVRPGGRLVYATCSLCRSENAEVLAAVPAAHPDFAPAPFARTFGFTPNVGGLTIWPAAHDTDGFYVASLRRQP